MKDLLVIRGILILCFELVRLLRGNWIRRFLMKKKGAAQLRKPHVMKPKNERDCPFCVKEKGRQESPKPEMPSAWRLRKGRGGPSKKISTQGYFCANPGCEYYRITDEDIHALVGYGSHGKQEPIQDLKVDVSALEEVFGVREITIRTWLCRSGMQGRNLHERFMLELELIHVQLDELWANVKHSTQDMWVWVVSDATTKIVPVLQVGGRTQEMAYRVVHELKGRLRAGYVPVFSTDGLKHYFYALTAHFGRWETAEGKKSIWVLLSDFVYAQVIKHQRRRRIVQVERRIMWGNEKNYRERLKIVGLSGKINTSFVERVNLTIRQCIAKLTRRTWGPAHYTPELLEHLKWWRAYYHFVRYHESLEVALATPNQRKGKQQPVRYRRRTPAMAAGLTYKHWTVKELLSYPLP